DFMTDTNKFHGAPLNTEQYKLALPQLEETLGDY
ncbi:MAG TPA: transketolase, partial [Bacteroidia bacterium]|nr:transketolase [Bacteroidia bacterium]